MFRAFWITILTLAGLTIFVVLIGELRSQGGYSHSIWQSTPTVVEIDNTVLGRIFRQASESSISEMSEIIDDQLDIIYAPTYSAISGYTSFHYSVRGEYTEIFGAALGTMSDDIEQRLFDGFEQRLAEASAFLDAEYSLAFKNNLERLLVSEIPEELRLLPIGDLTRKAIDDAIGRAKVTVPVGAYMARAGGIYSTKVIAKAVASKLALKVSLKAGTKTLVKSTTLLGGAGAGAAVGAVLGPPGSVVGGIIGGVVTWFAVDAAVINIDEFFNREEFEADVAFMIDENRVAVREGLVSALASKHLEMEDFTLGELSRGL